MDRGRLRLRGLAKHPDHSPVERRGRRHCLCRLYVRNVGNLNYTVGKTAPNAVITKLGAGGKICLFTQLTTHLVVDVDGYIPLAH